MRKKLYVCPKLSMLNDRVKTFNSPLEENFQCQFRPQEFVIEAIRDKKILETSRDENWIDKRLDFFLGVY